MLKKQPLRGRLFSFSEFRAKIGYLPYLPDRWRDNSGLFENGEVATFRRQPKHGHFLCFKRRAKISYLVYYPKRNSAKNS